MGACAATRGRSMPAHPGYLTAATTEAPSAAVCPGERARPEIVSTGLGFASTEVARARQPPTSMREPHAVRGATPVLPYARAGSASRAAPAATARTRA